jgi:hypothetical protein
MRPSLQSSSKFHRGLRAPDVDPSYPDEVISQDFAASTSHFAQFQVKFDILRSRVAIGILLHSPMPAKGR